MSLWVGSERDQTSLKHYGIDGVLWKGAEEDLRAIDESSNVFSSFAKQHCSERGHMKVLAEESREAAM